MKVRQILEVKGKTLFTVNAQAQLSDAVVSMAENDLGSLVVIRDGALAGILTFREVFRVLARRQIEHREGPTPTMSKIVVGDVMNANPLIASPDTEVNDLRRMMIEHHQRYLPVMDGTVLMGVLSFHDIARAVLEEQSFENKMLKAYIRDWPEEKVE